MAETTTVPGRDVTSLSLASTRRIVRRLRAGRDAMVDGVHVSARTLSYVLSQMMCFGVLVVFAVVAWSGPRGDPAALRGPSTVVHRVTMRRVVTQDIARDGAKIAKKKESAVATPEVAAPETPPASSAPPEAKGQAMAPPVPTTWSEQEIATAAAVCKVALTAPTIHSEAVAPMRFGGCGDAAPVKMSAAGEPSVTVEQPVTINCKTAAMVDQWVKTVLQPAAKEVLGSPVVSMSSTSSYVCRNRNGAAVGPTSEHAYANAFDVGSFKLADGRVIDVGLWGATVPKREPVDVAIKKAAAAAAAKVAGPGVPASAAGTASSAPATAPDVRLTFLKRIHHEACGLFGTVLGPEANEAHREHLHLDMKVRRGGKAFCE